MSTFSGQKNSGMEIPDYAIERIARSLLPMIQAYYESDEGQAELAAWNEKKDAEDAREQDRKTAWKSKGVRSAHSLFIFIFRRSGIL